MNPQQILTDRQAEHLIAATGDVRKAMAKARRAVANVRDVIDNGANGESVPMIVRELYVARMELINALQALQRAELNAGLIGI